MRCFVQIEKLGERYAGEVRLDDSSLAYPLTDLKLGDDARVKIKGKTYQLGELVDALLNYRSDELQSVYDDRGQLEIGQYLYQEIFGRIDAIKPERLPDTRVDVRIISADEEIIRLPWILLARHGIFLSTVGWSVAVASRAGGYDCELPPSPKMLLVAPQPAGVSQTAAESHITALEALLSGADSRHTRGRHLRVVFDWEGFKKAIAEFQPHILYYYGHGIGDRHSSSLVFATATGNRRVDIPLADVAACLRPSPDRQPPLLVYLNCCSGDAGGLLGAGRQLESFIPAVITNCTTALIDASQSFAMALWRSLLLEGTSPHTAIAEVRGKLSDLDLSLKDVRWITPVLHCHYASWKANPPRRLNHLERNPHWRLKLDRVRQFGQVAYRVTRMLRERKPRSMAYVWYGQEGQGVDLFHQRLKVELQEHLADTYLYECLPSWPVHFESPSRAFEEMLTEAFDVESLDQIPGRIRGETRGVSDRRTLVYVRHTPILPLTPFHLKNLKAYLAWWDRIFVPLLEGQVFGLLAVSFIVGKPWKFRQAIIERENMLELELHNTMFQLLDEMERLARKDLADFLQDHNIPLPPGRKANILDQILKETGGDYEMTLEKLKDLAARPWDFGSGPPGGHGQEDDYDYN